MSRAFLGGLLSVALFGCADSDPCAAYPGQACVALELRAGTSGLSQIDQVRITSGELGIHDALTPTTASLATLPVVVPVLGGSFSGAASITARALRNGSVVAGGATNGLGILAGQHQGAALDLSPPSALPAFSVVAGTPIGESLLAIWGSDPDHVFAVGSNGLHADRFDGTWHRAQTRLGRTFNAVWGTSATEVYSVATIDSNNHGAIERFDGTFWREEFVTETPLLGVWGSGGTVLAVAADGMLYGKQTGGTWEPRIGKALTRSPYAASSDPVLWSISGNNLDDFTMPAGTDRIYHYIGSGDFVNLDPAVDRTLSFRTVWAAPGPSTNVYLGGNYFGAYYLTTSNPTGAVSIGDNLYRMTLDQGPTDSANKFVNGIWGTDTHVLFVGDDGRIYDDPVATNVVLRVASPTTTRLNGVWGSSLEDIWIVGDRELILHGRIDP